MQRNREPQAGLPSLFVFLNLQSLCRLPLVLVHHLGVDLGGADVLMG